MIQLIDGTKNYGNAVIAESDKCLYLKCIEYDKQTLDGTPLMPFNIYAYNNSMTLSKILAPIDQKKWFNGLQTNNVMVDNSNNNICYTAPISNKTYDSVIGFGFNINNIKKNNNANINYYQVFKDESYYYVYNANVVKFLGQDDNYVYVSIVTTKPNFKYGDTAFPPDKDPTVSNQLGEITTVIYALKKNEDYNAIKIATLGKCYGNIKVIKETTDEIICIAGLYSNSYSQLYSFKINKNNQTHTVVLSDYIQYDSRMQGDIITPTDVIKIDDNNYEFYMPLMELAGTGSTYGYSNRNYYIYKYTVNTENLSFAKTKLNIDDINNLPYFGAKPAKFYNEIYYFENNLDKFLITSSNGFYENDPIPSGARVISYYKINEQDSKIEFIDALTTSDINGNFLGMLFDDKNLTFILMTDLTTYVLDVSSNSSLNLINLKQKNRMIGIDLESNYYGLQDDGSVYIYGKTKISSVDLKMEDIPSDVVYPLKTNLKLNVFNFKNERIETNIKLIGVGDNFNFDDNGSKIITVQSSSTEEVLIPITITNDTIFDVYPQVETGDIL